MVTIGKKYAKKINFSKNDYFFSFQVTNRVARRAGVETEYYHMSDIILASMEQKESSNEDEMNQDHEEETDDDKEKGEEKDDDGDKNEIIQDDNNDDDSFDDNNNDNDNQNENENNNNDDDDETKQEENKQNNDESNQSIEIQPNSESDLQKTEFLDALVCVLLLLKYLFFKIFFFNYSRFIQINLLLLHHLIEKLYNKLAKFYNLVTRKTMIWCKNCLKSTRN